MVEVILPGTYITVRDEGLISAGAVAAGNIGIVGTAAKGPVNTVCILGSFSEAREMFGDADPWPLTMDPQKPPLTLVRALQLVYNNGGRTVYAVRTARQDAPRAATYVLRGTQPAVTLTAKTPGTAGNAMTIKISTAPAPNNDKKAIELQSGNVTETYEVADAADFAEQVRQKPSQLVTVEASGNIQKSSEWTNTPARGASFQGGTGGASPLAATYVIQGQGPMVTLIAKTPGTWGNTITIKIAKAPESDKKAIELVCGVVKESYLVDDAQDLATQVKKKSHLVVAGEPASDAQSSTWLDTTAKDGVPFQGGTNGEAATAQDYAASLARLEGEIINIVVLAGQDASMKDSLEAHIKITEEIKRERIGIIGSNGTSTLSTITRVTSELDSPRIIYTAPGLKASTTDPDTEQVVQVTLPGAYTAAAVAGLISSLPVQTSPTNKTLTIEGVSAEFSSSQLENLVTNRVLAVEKRNGYRIVKGITTATNSAWHQITTRRIVDYALYGVRSACDPYIGKLNNTRVRGAMKATLDAFLTRMVDSEALVGYKVDVSATRAQEIAGQAIVTMTIQPTFSIDYIMVTMYLG